METYWREEYEVRSYQIDFQGEATLGAMGRFMQEVATAHAEHLGVGFEALSGKGMAWVLARQRIEIERMPGMGETITARTWPTRHGRLFFYRDFAFTGAGGSPLLRANTTWFAMAVENRMPQPAEAFLDDPIPMGESQFDREPAKLRPDADGEAGAAFPVRYGDLDVNGHVNNVRYLEWLMDDQPVEFHRRNRLRSIEVNYVGEAVPGDDVRIVTTDRGGSRMGHRIACGQRNFLLARTGWDAR